MIFSVFLIASITLIFLLFSSDINARNEKFLKALGLRINPRPISFEEIAIPEEFDNVYKNYNLIQLVAGFDLSEYKGMEAVRYTYEILNFPEDKTVYANVICVNSKPIAGDICCPSTDGFILPLNYLTKTEHNTIFPQ